MHEDVHVLYPNPNDQQLVVVELLTNGKTKKIFNIWQLFFFFTSICGATLGCSSSNVDENKSI